MNSLAFPQRRCGLWKLYGHIFCWYSIADDARLPWANGSNIGVDTLTYYWRWRAGHLLRTALTAPPDLVISNAPTASEQTYFVNPAALKCTRDLHSITCFVGMESITLQHPCILLAFCCALGMRGNPVQRQWRYGHMECLFSYLCSYSY